MAIKILIADDHALLRQGVKRVLNFEDDLEVVGEAEDGQETLARTLVLQPDVLLLDLNMPGLSGLEVACQLQAAKSKTKIIVLTIHDSDKYVLELLKNGVLGYLLKDVEPSMLIKAIHVVNEGEAFVYPSLAERLFGGIAENEDITERARTMWREGRAFLHREGLQQSRHRTGALRQREDGEEPSDEHLQKAQRQRPHAGADLCAEAQDHDA